MSGSFERLMYDPAAYARDLKQSTDPIRYRLDPSFANTCRPCRAPQVGWIGKVGVSLTHQRPLVDVESDLKLLDYRASRDPQQKYIPDCKIPNHQRGGGDNTCMEGYPCGGGVVAGCQARQEQLYHFPSCDIGTDYTRISNPICTSRGVGINRFAPLCLQPQDEDRWLTPSQCGINYRMVVKDNHVPCVPRPVDPTPLLPKGGELPCPPVEPVCGNYLKPLHPEYKNLNRNWNCMN